MNDKHALPVSREKKTERSAVSTDTTTHCSGETRSQFPGNSSGAQDCFHLRAQANTDVRDFSRSLQNQV